MHIFFAYTTKTFAFKSVVFQRRWGTELFFHAKVCISVVSRLFKETCPVKWKPSALQFINEHCQYKIKIKKSEYSTTTKKLQIFVFLSATEITCGESIFWESDPCPYIHYIQDPRRQWGAGFQTQLQQALLTPHPKFVSLWWALILYCLFLVFSLGSSISPLVSCSVSCPSSQFGLGIYLSPGCPPVSVDCCN